MSHVNYASIMSSTRSNFKKITIIVNFYIETFIFSKFGHTQTVIIRGEGPSRNHSVVPDMILPQT